MLLAGLFLAIAAWSLAYPAFTGPDEPAHAIESAATARGQVLGRIEQNYVQIVRVPELYGRASKYASCFQAYGEITPACAPRLRGGSRLVHATTYEFRGSSPAYYLLTGLPTLALPGSAGFYVMRLLNAAAGTALLGLGCWAAFRSRSRWLALGVLAAITPEVLLLSGVLNPNGLEAAAAIAAWACLVALRIEPVDRWAPLIRGAGVAVVVLVASRGLSPFFALVIVAAAMLVLRPGDAAALTRRRDARRWATAAAVVGALSLAWSAYVNFAYWLPGQGNGFAHGLGRIPEFARGVVAGVAQIGGLLHVRDLPLPDWFYATWGFVVLAIVVAGLARGTNRARAVLVGLVVATTIIPVLGDTYGLGGQFWLGRHVLALACGIPILGAALAASRADGERRVESARERTGLAVLIAGLVVEQILAFAWSLHRYAVGLEGPWSVSRFLFDPRWSPLLPGPVLLAVFACGIGVVALLGGWRTRAIS